MKRLRSFAVTTISLLILGAALIADNAVAQQKSLEEQLVGTWTHVPADSVRNVGSKIEVFGPNQKGTLILTSDSHFALVQMRADLPKMSSNSRERGTPEERLITSLTAEELKFVNPRTPSGATLEVGWKRAT